MKNIFPIAPTAVAAFLMVAFATVGLTQTAQNTTPAQPAPAAAPATGAYQNQAFAPGFDDLMTMLVQPRHIKLYYAGTAKNWELAAAEARDLRASLDRTAQTIPSYEGNDVRLAIRNFITSKIDAVDTAIAKADSQTFASAYQDLTTGCNECHMYMEHPFLVIKKPDGTGVDPAHADQDFIPRP